MSETTPDLDIEELLGGETNRLRHIQRFSTCFRAHTETVAEHCYFTSWYSLVIGWWLREKGEPIDLGLLLSRALVHDLEEARVGDVFRPFKYSSPELLAEIEKAAATQLPQVTWPLMRSVEFDAWILERWEHAKDPATTEGCVVAFADYLSVLGYVLQELRAGNGTIADQQPNLETYARIFDAPDFNALRELVIQTELFAAAMWEGC